MTARPRNSLYNMTLKRTIIPLVVLLLVFLLFCSIMISLLTANNAQLQLEHQQERLEDRLAEIEKQLIQIDYRQRVLLNARQLVRFVYLYNSMDWYTRYEIQNDLKNELLTMADSDPLVKEAWLYLPSLNKYISNRNALSTAPTWFSSVSGEQSASLFEKNGVMYNLARGAETNDQAQPISIVILDSDRIHSELRYALINEKSSISVLLQKEPTEEQQADADLVMRAGGLDMIVLYYGASSYQTQFSKLLIGIFGLFVLLAIASVCVVLLQWNQRLYKPLRRLLVEAFDHAENGDLSYRITIDEDSPFVVEYQSYNHMMDCMEKYVETNLKQQLLVNQANLKQLQSQINPHFMYNTYYILYRLIKKGDQENSQRLAEYLGQFYHYITRNADDEKPLEKEVEHARIYAEIQHYRFRDALEIEIEPVDERIARTYVPRLILQPVLENAFKYVYEAENTTGMMKLWVHYQVVDAHHFDIYVENSGTIADEVLDSIVRRLNNTAQAETTALVNIHKRLQIYFGKQSGIRVRRSTLGGLLVCMHIEDDREA